MQRNEQSRFMRHARGQAVVVAQPRPNLHHKFLVMGAYLIASAIIALWMAYLPTVAGNILTQLNTFWRQTQSIGCIRAISLRLLVSRSDGTPSAS